MLGQALMGEACKRRVQAIGAARQNCELCLDVRDDRALTAAVKKHTPEVIINTVADVKLAACEKDPGYAYSVNARPAAVLAGLTRGMDAYLIQISTDHYYLGREPVKHREEEEISLVNEYARTKYAAEQFVLTDPNALVVRTNIVGFRGRKDSPTFVEWIIRSLQDNSGMMLFSDYYTSSLDVKTFARALFDLLTFRPKGILNLGSSEVFSKKAFIEALAAGLGYVDFSRREGSINEMNDIPRANNLGLDVARAQALLQQKLPTLGEVICNLLEDYQLSISDSKIKD